MPPLPVGLSHGLSDLACLPLTPVALSVRRKEGLWRSPCYSLILMESDSMYFVDL